jgi:hypothetical protein
VCVCFNTEEKLSKFNLSKEIDSEWDPQQYDEMMKKMFNEEYYQEKEDAKPEFDDDLDLEVIFFVLSTFILNKYTTVRNDSLKLKILERKRKMSNETHSLT